MQLRDYQHKLIDDLRESIRRGARAPLMQASTGLGKTIISSGMIRSAVEKGNRVLFIAPRRQLVWQTSEKLTAFGVPHGIIMAGEQPSMSPQVQVASVQTLYSRCFVDGEAVRSSIYGRGMPLPEADLVVIDEAHAVFGEMSKKILAEYPQAIKIGMTATPCRADGRGLGEIYDDIVCGPSTRWAMDNGYLAELRYFGPSEWDMTGIKIQAGDYHKGQLSERVNKAKLVGDVVENWTRIAPDKKTVVFAVDRKHAKALQTEFLRWGIAAEYIDGNTPQDERQQIFQRMESGRSMVLCSVAVVDMGWDAPWAECGVLARPTKSLARFLQAVGRILRPMEGKDHATLIDHTGAVRELGFVDDDFQWTLDGVEKREAKDPERKVKEKTVVECPKCKAEFRPGPECPNCGADMTAHSQRAIDSVRAELQEIERAAAKKAVKEMTLEQKGRFLSELLGYATKKGYKDGWAVHAYKEKTGVLPWPVWPQAPREPGPETMGWITHLNIKRAKRRAA